MDLFCNSNKVPDAHPLSSNTVFSRPRGKAECTNNSLSKISSSDHTHRGRMSVARVVRELCCSSTIVHKVIAFLTNATVDPELRSCHTTRSEPFVKDPTSEYTESHTRRLALGQAQDCCSTLIVKQIILRSKRRRSSKLRRHEAANSSSGSTVDQGELRAAADSGDNGVNAGEFESQVTGIAVVDRDDLPPFRRQAGNGL